MSFIPFTVRGCRLASIPFLAVLLSFTGTGQAVATPLPVTPLNIGSAHSPYTPTASSRKPLISYAEKVYSRIARLNPRGEGRTGRVVIIFSLDKTGALKNARVKRSSGDSALDNHALAIVMSAAPFPEPPAGAHPSQLRFSIPFRFHGPKAQPQWNPF